ncbi:MULTISPECIES: hypothetical protein [Streptomyces]|uniref:Uncharacterized protein n=1 Tax=Streptomyces solicathayae TaxID=3081768 RepID=A0ABZ0M3N8_9ACTN|nr:hypothetical protein [Streptomyces sp. HUAS YS2]WOX26120.1 hypothetical protein R2D22_33940 [Streptomyces sp. HUAS YS2]
MPSVPSDPPVLPDFRPTHVVPREGLPAWEAPDPSLPTDPLDAFLPVQLVDRVGDWGQIVCSNGWSAWVDGRLLIAVPQDPPAAGQPAARTADPRPLIARAEDSLGRFRRAAEELAAGRSDGETFRRRTRGLRVGMVVDGESLWLFDAEHERWVYCDGAALATYATSGRPAAAGQAAPEPAPEPAAGGHRPTQVVPEAAAAGPEATQVVPQTDLSPPDPEATQVVPPVAPGTPGAPAPPEPTRVVDVADAAGEGGRSAERGDE